MKRGHTTHCSCVKLRRIVPTATTRAESSLAQCEIARQRMQRIADDFGPDNDVTHFSSAYRKTNTAGIADLNAKLFAPNRA